MRKPAASRKNVALRTDGAPAARSGAAALGALALGALAVGAVAYGAVAIGRLAVGKARFRAVEIDELVVKNLHFGDAERP
jgi:hypothetical protein